VNDVAACDASPIVALHRIGRLDLLVLAARDVVVPQAVVVELDARVPCDGAFAALGAVPAVRVVADVPFSRDVLARGLGRGESQVLSLATSVPGTRAILDDMAARRCAAELGIRVIGTIGLVALARRRGVLPAARPVLAALVDAGLRVSPGLLRSVLVELGES
jgi:predicted nucleic acid-binding protein